MLLANLLRDMLPADAYRLQYTFRSGERVDAVIRVDKLLPVDAKFPLDNFERLANAEADDERELHEKAFGRDVKGHIDAIASKYIRPAEGTFDFAFMYLPSEAVYYELVCGKTGNLSAYAHGKRVIAVSPGTLHAYLLMVTQGLAGAPDRAARPGRHGVLRPDRQGLRPLPRRLRGRRQAHRERPDEVQRRPIAGWNGSERASSARRSGSRKPSRPLRPKSFRALWTPPRPD